MAKSLARPWTAPGRTLAEAVGGLGPSLPRIWAIASMTLLEASRRKVFAILLLFAGALLSSVAFFPAVEMSGRLRLVEAWALRASGLFTAIVALFVAGFSLPGDFEQKRIYLLVTKPVSKAAIFLGRFVGFAMLLAAFIGAMGLVTTSFIRIIQLAAGPAFPPPAAYPRLGTSEFLARGGFPAEGNPSIRFIDGGKDQELAWRFRGLSRTDFAETLRVETKLSIGSPVDRFRASGNVRIEARNAAGRRVALDRFINTNEEKEYAFPADLVGEDGAIEIAVRCADGDGRLMASRESLVVYGKSIVFEANFLRGLGLILLQSLVVLSLTLAASTFVSAPLSILLGILLYLVGNLHGFVLEGTRDIERSLQELREAPEGKKARSPEDLPTPVLDYSSAVSKVVLAAVPDFDHFDFSRWLLKDRCVSWGELAEAASRALLPVIVPAFLGMLVMMFKDFG